jgi:hypothetical protein
MAIGLPLVVLALMVLWWAWVGRDPRPGSIVPEWRPPDGVPPGAAGSLVDQRAGPADVLATLLDLASRGYLTIREVHPSGVPAQGDEAVRMARTILESVGVWTTEWEFRRTDLPLEDLAPFEGAIVHALLGGARSVTMSAVAPSFRQVLPGIYRSMYGELVGRGWFRHSPQATRREWLVLGGAMAAIGAAAIVWLGRVEPGIGLTVSGGIVMAFAPVMPVVTREGARARDRLLGLREYVRRVERAEVEARHRGQSVPAHFEEILPYAIALGVVDLWLKEFAGLTEGPGWYLVEGVAEPTSFTISMDIFWNAAIDAFGAAGSARAG